MSLSSKSDLRIDWATHAAAKYACENWHYSGCMPAPIQKRFALGAWERDKFMGVILFSHGASPQIGKPYGLTVTECCELTRIALSDRHLFPVSRLISYALKQLKVRCPGLRLVVSYADIGQAHYGGIYQASNWIYVGKIKGPPLFYWRGKVWHNKAIKTSYPAYHKDKNVKALLGSDKHKYLKPLDNEMAAKLLPLAQPYPKRPKQATPGTTGEAAGQNRPGRSNLPKATD